MNVTKDGVTVRTGQVWSDQDWRHASRFVKVVLMGDGYAHARRCNSDGTYPDPDARTTRLVVRRMHKHSTGWVLVKEAVEYEHA